MARIKYIYDTETCRYERAKITKSDVTLNFLGFLAVALVMALSLVLAYNTYFETPVEAQLKKENNELKKHYSALETEMEEVDEVIAALAERDNNIYRKIYEAEPLSPTVLQAGSGGVDLYRDILEEGLQNEELVVGTKRKIDKLKKQARIVNQSFDEIMKLAKNNDELLKAIPAIQPVHNPNLTQLVSGFGNRINPFHKARVMHEGIDFAATRGSEVYATGNGKIKMVKINSELETGYGNYIEIDHGFGYISKYAHLGKVNLKVGDVVTRGMVIGQVGSSGGSTAPHVHYEIIKDGVKLDPINYIMNGVNNHDYSKLIELASRENQSFD
ncbi:M23 family metallopeptidase [Fulvivirga lutimaris]|uniref:M23 family metallopeptidase n=1 Tax=Fulvivirga lutimaris TaxID=1819566 RepID=UPI0012BC9378|nr:M23 family metallopeptidase [Fulvivirga lutimaris]MTI39345.1 M23 family metallopeptidase [Fulvivirga lutimaris]